MTVKAPVVILYNTYTTWLPEDIALGQKYLQEMVNGLRTEGHRVEVVEFWQSVGHSLQGYDPNEWIIFNWCEGVEGEVGGDARLCEDLQTLGYTYTGNPPAALRLSVQKGQVKRVLNRWHIPTPPGQAFRSANDIKAWAYFPAIVKPVSQHCSAGVTRAAVVHDLATLRERVNFINTTFNEAALVEAFITGREINVGIWGNGRPRILPLREIDFSAIPDPFHQMVTWDSKWVPSSEDWNKMPIIYDVRTSPTLYERIEKIALDTYRVFECRDYARVDFRIDADENPWVVDVNPNPDICWDGGFIGGCKMLGYSYGQAISHIVQMAVTRRNRRNTLITNLRQRKLALA